MAKMAISPNWNLRSSSCSLFVLNHSCFYRTFCSSLNISFSSDRYPLLHLRRSSCTIHAKEKSSQSEPSLLKPTIVEEVTLDDEEEDIFDELQDEGFMNDDDYFEDEYAVENSELRIGDGGEGGGISLSGTWWDKQALAIAEEVSLSFDGDLKIYAFKTFINSTIKVRIEKLSNKYGSPSMDDIEAFSTAFRARLDEAELAGSIPQDIFLEVSSPGVERILRIPQDLDRFKDKPMYVKYATEVGAAGSLTESDGVFRLVSFDLETSSCTWGLADVRINRDKAGKGRPLSKKQREWRLSTPFDSLHLVRLYSEI
ncbi:hypothetical protein NE237_029647 [Protea cynaroides]|uniref:Ribosome maturation factor RimP N-terminal domain-containing protein n=1 Tax=Protea cynaroides TaxID=273540 RepID=A0A9Q0GSP6_9MAGN|nr:hypothetical protein NE237_029647 [Protea cynaroides]